MRAARLVAPGDLRIVDLPVPTPGPDEALVRVVAYGPYGTDIGVFLNRDGRYVKSYPVGIGADFAGVVTAIGKDVRNTALGDRVTALALAHCGVCDNCRRGKTNLCLDKEFYSGARQICCQEFTLIKARKIARLPETVTFDDAATLAGVVVALNAYELMGVRAGDSLAVIGVGAMGLAAIAAAVALGLTVVALGGTGKRAQFAQRLGARSVIALRSHGEDAAVRALALSPRGYPFILETTATDWGLRQAFAIAAFEASVAVTGGNAFPVSIWDVIGRELRVVGVRAGHQQEQALALVAEGRIDLKPTITARFPLERAADAFALMTGPQAPDIGRVIIEPG